MRNSTFLSSWSSLSLSLSYFRTLVFRHKLLMDYSSSYKKWNHFNDNIKSTHVL